MLQSFGTYLCNNLQYAVYTYMVPQRLRDCKPLDTRKVGVKQMVFFYSTIVLMIVGILFAVLIMIRFKKESFYARLESLFCCLLIVLLCVASIYRYHGEHRLPLDPDYLRKIDYETVSHHAERLEANGYVRSNTVDNTSATEYVYHADNGTLRIFVTLQTNNPPIAAENSYTLSARYKSFWARLWNQTENQSFRLLLKSPACEITMLDLAETEDYPERIYRQIDALAELFPVDQRA